MGAVDWGPVIALLGVAGGIITAVVSAINSRAAHRLGIATREDRITEVQRDELREVADMRAADLERTRALNCELENAREAAKLRLRAQGDYIDELRTRLRQAGIDPGPRPTDI